MPKSILYPLTAFLIAIPFSSCSSSAIASAGKLQKSDEFTPLRIADCETLIKKYNNPKEDLRNLAGLYANRKCKDFSLDFKTIPDQEKRIFRAKFDELDENKKTETKDTETIESLKSVYNKATEPDEKFEAFKKLRQKYRSSNKIDASFNLIKSYHESVLKKISGKKADQKYYPLSVETTLFYSRALWAKQEPQKAYAQINKTLNLLEKLPAKQQPALFDLYFVKGKINEEAGSYDQAVIDFDKAIANFNTLKENKRLNGKSFDAAKVEWSKAWMLYKNSSPEKASVALRKIVENSNDVSEKSRARFFLARCYKKLSQQEEAQKLLAENTEEDFYSFYSLASYHELEKPLPALQSLSKKNIFKFDEALTFLDEKQKNILNGLIRNEEIEMLDRAALVLTKNNVEYVNMGIYLAEKSNLFMPLFTGFARLPNSEKKDIFVKHGRLLFPQVHEEKVLEMSKKTNISSALIYSIMKQESGFNPESRSHANAFGLMQVIPPLAKNLAKKYKIDFKGESDLYNPMINIEIGTYELKDQVDKQNGQLSFVASAYNAGPNALKRWVNREPIQDMFEFIESIPYDETRSYVKIIARNMLFYQRLADPSKEHRFPAEFIKVDAM